MRIVCIGDSITYGQNVRSDQAWPFTLGLITGYDVRNAGVCGDTTRLGLERWQKHVALHNPDAIVIQFGHNDANIWDTDYGHPRVSLDAYTANVREMVDRATVMGATPFVLAPHYAPGKSVEYNDRLYRYRQSLDKIALEPPHVSIADDGYGLHPDPDMHSRYAYLVARSLALVSK